LSGPTPLAGAAVSGEFISARYLLDHGANPNKIDGTGFAALHAAAKNGLSLSLCNLHTLIDLLVILMNVDLLLNKNR
jgi:ankyrin repeat protein